MEDSEKMERVEKLREKAGITYEEAKNALEASNWDTLDALVYLESIGKVKPPQNSTYSTGAQSQINNNYVQQYRDYEYTQQQCNKRTITDHINDFFNWCADMLRKGNENYFCAERNNERPIEMPITVFIVLLIVGFWVIIILMLVGLFLGFRYSIKGADVRGKEADDINKFMDKAADKATEIKEDIFNGSDSDR